jgi:hypothetical protein
MSHFMTEETLLKQEVKQHLNNSPKSRTPDASYSLFYVLGLSGLEDW